MDADSNTSNDNAPWRKNDGSLGLYLGHLAQGGKRTVGPGAGRQFGYDGGQFLRATTLRSFGSR